MSEYVPQFLGLSQTLFYFNLVYFLGCVLIALQTNPRKNFNTYGFGTHQHPTDFKKKASEIK